MPTVSVIMPAYNHEQFIRQAIASVQNQSLRDWELIVVDDGSTDGTAQIVTTIGDPRIFYRYQHNQGCPAALNTGLQKARSQFVTILASDDLLLPEALSTLHKTLEEHEEADVVYGDGYIVDEQGQVVGELAQYRRVPFGETLDSMVVASPVVGVHSAMMRRKALDHLEGPFDELMSGYEDWDLFVRMKAQGSAFLYVSKPVCSYRFHGANKSAPLSNQSERRRQAMIRKRLKEINEPWFGSLSLPAKYVFFEDFLVNTLQGDRTSQEQVVVHQSFQSLPAKTRSALLYRLTIGNILSDGARREDKQRLWTSIRIAPTNLKAYPLLALTLAGDRLPEQALSRWRQARVSAEPSDPVTKILRAKNVA